MATRKQLVPWLRDHAPATTTRWWCTACGSSTASAVHRALRGGPVPYFIYPHGMLDPWFKRTLPAQAPEEVVVLAVPPSYRVLRDAAAVLFTAGEEAAAGRAIVLALRSAKPAVVGYGVALGERETQLGSRRRIRATPGPQTQRQAACVLFHELDLHPKKGGDLLIEAFAQVAPSSDPNLHLVMAGPDDRSGVRAGLEALSRRSRCGRTASPGRAC